MTPLIDAVATHARTRPHATACIDLESGGRWTYAALNRDVDRTAAWLVKALGPASAARVAAVARNSVALLVLHLAAIRAGAIFVPLNWRLALPEIADLLEDAQPALLFHDAEFEIPSFGGSRYVLADLALLVADTPMNQHLASPHSADLPATLLYTSGTSGRPKGVIVTESNAFWGSTNFNLGNDVTMRSVFLCDMPMFHTAGLFAAVRSPLLAGATVLISRGFHAPKTLARLGDRLLGVTHYFSVPQMAQALWQHPTFDANMLRQLTVYAMGGAPNPAAQIERFVRAGVKMSDGFGMTETCSNFGMPTHDPQLLLAKAGSCGLPYMSLRARVVDDDGRDLGDGERGELWLRGPSITPGYWNKPELTAAAFCDGWFKTGDTALRDRDGFYYLVDRKKDMYISGGENVYPAEVEAVLAEIEGIAEVAVIGVPDVRWGEVGYAFIVASPGQSFSTDEVLAHCRTRLAGFKAPARVVFTDSIPRTPSGKIQKHVLKSLVLQQAHQ